MSDAINAVQDRTVMVTGGAGYVGSILLRRMLQAGYKTVCVDCLRYGGSSLLDIWGHPNFVLEKVDITNYKAMDNLFDRYRFHGIVHLAAIVGDPACKLEPDLARRTNLDASAHLLDKSVQSQVSRFIFASTCSNYGKMGDTDYVDETSPLAPVSLYAELKVEIENIILNNLNKDASFCPTVLRFSTVFGVSPRMRFDLTVNEFTKELALGRELQVFGEQFWRPYCHVNDFSRAILAVMNSAEEKVAYDVFNVGDTLQNYTKKMLLDEILKQIPDGKVKFVHKDDDPRDYRVNFNKINKMLNFNISKTVPDGIRDIMSCIKYGIIGNPDDQIYYNIPV
jgi:nucleoside-diphosphate-sugar epimerase